MHFIFFISTVSYYFEKIQINYPNMHILELIICKEYKCIQKENCVEKHKRTLLIYQKNFTGKNNN